MKKVFVPNRTPNLLSKTDNTPWTEEEINLIYKAINGLTVDKAKFEEVVSTWESFRNSMDNMDKICGRYN